jgi:hypothetical protein
MPEENIKSKTIRLGDSGVTEIEYSDADGNGFREEVEVGPGDALVVTDPSGFTLAVHGPPAEAEEENDG